jgi:hypothetical protein
MDVREAFHAGMNALINPITAATARQASTTGG